MTDDVDYDRRARAELAAWREAMQRRPGPLARASKNLQGRINRLIPERVHQGVTIAMEQMIRTVLTGSVATTAMPLIGASLAEREAKVAARIDAYRKIAAAEGGVTGAGGFLLGLADFPALIALKLKLLFEIAALYGHDPKVFGERVFILEVFQLAFSSADHRRQVYEELLRWEEAGFVPPASFEGFEWRKLQQEYRDYIDLVKLAQMMPVIGAPVGFVVNYSLLGGLGRVATGAYRLRWFAGRD